MTTPSDHRPQSAWRLRLHEIIFEADTALGRAFDVMLLGGVYGVSADTARQRTEPAFLAPTTARWSSRRTPRVPGWPRITPSKPVIA